jgi:hypothetical protein
MKYLYSLLLGLALGASSVFVYNLYPPFGLLLSLAGTSFGVWASGRKWGGRTYRFIVAIVWVFVVLRAGFPGLNNEYLIQGDGLGTSLLNIGFMVIVIAIIMPV